MSKRILALCGLIIFLTAAFLSYFNKYSPDLTPAVDPAYETSAPELQASPDPKFAEKLVVSNIAMVLDHSDFSDTNAVALDALRTWAKEKFCADMLFLHPVSMRYSEHHDTVFSAFLFNLFGPERGLLERGIKEFLRQRIDDFHNTEAYQSFRVDYYGLFGVDPEAALLLARYQEERAKLASMVITGCLLLFLAGLLCATYYFRSKQWLSRGRLTLSYAWFAASVLYLGCGWHTNELSFLVSSLVSLLVALYLRFPVSISFDEVGYLELRAINLSTQFIAIASWASLTLVAIQVLTWIKSGNLIEPDPITLLISSFTGNFLHDPSQIKRAISHGVGITWLLFSLSVFYFLKRGAARTPELDAQLEKLDHASLPR